jgi:hypothetical protein
VPDDVTLARLWRKLSDNQRLHLVNELPGIRRVQTSDFVVAGRVLDRLGLFARPSYLTRLSKEGEELARWAVENGYARRTDTGWDIHAPEAPRRSRIDRNRLAELAEKGLHAAAIAAELNVTREAVRQAAQRHNLTLSPKSVKPKPAPRPPRVVRRERLVVAVTADELATIQQAAASAGLSVSTYLRRTVLDDDPPTV